ncbi:MAG: biopolymer transporter ExbD [Methylococcales bacterium]|jgi:biopolymer transport protein ExbD
MNFRHRKKRNLEISITPMIDVVFLLLIFFMVTTTFNKNTALQITLPESGSKELAPRKLLVLSIDSTSQYYLNEQPLADNKLSTLAHSLASVFKDKEQALVINADALAPYQAVVNALDIAGRVGFVQITFATQQATEK